jgi:hypothetical protein
MSLAATYIQLTDTIAAMSGLSRPMLHVHAGMAIYVLTQLLLGERRGSLVAVSMVVLAELGNETLERIYWGSWRLDDTLSDVVTTLFWPTVCLAVSTYGRWRWQRAVQRRAVILARTSEDTRASV